MYRGLPERLRQVVAGNLLKASMEQERAQQAQQQQRSAAQQASSSSQLRDPLGGQQFANVPSSTASPFFNHL